ncbi:cbb3-type cytochrome oxidase assembly protein CcoS [Rhodospirillum sp. A1_3_36]|uniref:cbb3-type cytochrome oxidase assembly protein CcoS n=1 Tax=Rhodospirillum sp. A1_3_36 TaxID=3391666 RepID=UPI0039A5E0DF
MDILLYLIPIALGMGGIGLGAFLWALKSGQFEDLDGAAHRILFEDDDIPPPPAPTENTHKDNHPKDDESN